jgi:hypothetical protein
MLEAFLKGGEQFILRMSKKQFSSLGKKLMNLYFSDFNSCGKVIERVSIHMVHQYRHEAETRGTKNPFNFGLAASNTVIRGAKKKHYGS